MYVGVAGQKNGLGASTFLSASGLVWKLVELGQSSTRRVSWWDMRHYLITLGLALHLLLLSQSKTSLVSFIVLMGVYWMGHLPSAQRNPRGVLIACCIGLPLILLGEELFRISHAILALLGRDPTLTERTDLWQVILASDMNRVVGWGFYSFWDTSVGWLVSEQTDLSVAHNGYLELYLDGGIVGICLLAFVLLSGLLKTGSDVLTRGPAGFITFGLVITALLYNIAESAFFRPSAVWFCYLFASIVPLTAAEPSGCFEPTERTGNAHDACLPDKQSIHAESALSH